MIEGARVGTVVVGGGGGASSNEENSTRVGAGVGWGGRRNTGSGAGGSAGGPCGVLYGKHSMFLVRKGSRDICSQQLIELACT